jgi:dTDP-glucose 4,6-dehydratase
MIRALVTGASGFLGSHLTDTLINAGHTVIGVDNLCTGDPKNLEHLRHESRFTFLEHDITKPFNCGAVDYIFNFASPASPPEYNRLGIETLMVGSKGTQNVLDLAVRYEAKFLHASTSECYGDPDVHPQPETYWGNVNPVGPRSVYDESKRFSEALIMAYHRYRKVDSRMVRIFNTYGPRLSAGDGRVISNFFMQALRGEPLTIYGDGEQTRSFCYVSDLIDGIMRLSESEEHLPVNIGNPDEWTIQECAQAILEVTESSSTILHLPLPEDDPVRRRPDITKAKTILGWEPKIGLKEGLNLSLEYFREALAAERTGSPAA